MKALSMGAAIRPPHGLNRRSRGVCARARDPRKANQTDYATGLVGWSVARCGEIGRKYQMQTGIVIPEK
jgi:hypothetical protein